VGLEGLVGLPVILLVPAGEVYYGRGVSKNRSLQLLKAALYYARPPTYVPLRVVRQEVVHLQRLMGHPMEVRCVRTCEGRGLSAHVALPRFRLRACREQPPASRITMDRTCPPCFRKIALPRI
jgi:hypothetical protein